MFQASIWNGNLSPHVMYGMVQFPLYTFRFYPCTKCIKCTEKNSPTMTATKKKLESDGDKRLAEKLMAKSGIQKKEVSIQIKMQ